MTYFRLPRRAFIQGSVVSTLLPGAGWTQEREPEGGIGGTGIVGVLTDFGSLIVGGRRVETTQDTRFSNGFGALEERDLAIGDSLTVDAIGPADQLKAVRVHVTHPLVGRITNIASGGREIIVNRIRVVVEGEPVSQGLGERVVVSGLWRDNTVFASRVSTANGALDLISGTVDRRGRGPRIGGLPLRLPAFRGVVDGSFATIIGRYDAERGQFQAEQVDTGRFSDTGQPLKTLVVEGYLQTAREAPGFRIAGLGHSFERNLRLEPFAQGRVLFSGDYTGLFAADSAVVLPQDVAQRGRLLSRLSR